MEVTKLEVNRERAQELWQKYQAHRDYQTPVDEAIERVYKEIARGRTVIQAIKSIQEAGLNEQGRPRLAIARADTEVVYFCYSTRPYFASERWSRRNIARSKCIHLPANAFGEGVAIQDGQAQVPLIPVHLRPKRGLANYHILWEANWTAPPHDPYLLRRMVGDTWLVVAAWDLTSVERAAMAGRLNA